MYYHLFVYGTDKYVDPIDRIKGDKKTGLFSVDMVITKAHFSIIFLTWLSKRKCCSNYENFKNNCRKPDIYDDLSASKVHLTTMEPLFMPYTPLSTLIKLLYENSDCPSITQFPSFRQHSFIPGKAKMKFKKSSSKGGCSMLPEKISFARIARS